MHACQAHRSKALGALVVCLTVVGTIGLMAVPAAAVTISSLSPQSGPVGTTVTIRGNGFMGATDVRFANNRSAAFSVNSNTRITATVPSQAQTGPIEVVTPTGTATSADEFVVTATDAPSIDGFSPTSGPVGTPVTIEGTNFNGATGVRFGTTSAVFSVVSSLEIAATVPTGASTGPISVTTPAGTATSSSSFSVTTATAPTITSFSPTFGVADTVVTITGTGFTDATEVRFKNKSATFTVNSATQITTTVPSGAQTGPISVTTPSGIATSATDFTVGSAPPPQITSFSPTSGPVGTRVTVSGSGFTGVTRVEFNGVSATFQVVSDVQVNATVPDGATTGPIRVTTGAGTGTSSSSFTVTSPFVSSFSPGSAPWGTTVVITGGNLSQITTVRFNGMNATFAIASAAQVTAVVPNGATTGPIAVSGPAGSGTSTRDFIVKHLRSLTLGLSGHLLASGTLSAVDGTSACASGMPVKIQRRVSGSWRTVGSVMTNGAGGYSIGLADRSGRYRARAPKRFLANGDACARTRSPVAFT